MKKILLGIIISLIVTSVIVYVYKAAKSYPEPIVTKDIWESDVVFTDFEVQK